jgi:ribosome-associated protein YbcJ (S4-like RNA binding protein)
MFLEIASIAQQRKTKKLFSSELIKISESQANKNAASCQRKH